MWIVSYALGVVLNSDEKPRAVKQEKTFRHELRARPRAKGDLPQLFVFGNEKG